MCYTPIPIGFVDALKPVHEFQRRTIDFEYLPCDLMTLARTVDQPWGAPFAHQIKRRRLHGDELARHADSGVCVEVREAFLQRAEDEHEVRHER